MPRFIRVLRRIDVRLTFSFVAVFVAASLLLYAFIFMNLLRTLRDEDHRALQAKALGLLIAYRTAGNEETAMNMLIAELSNEALSSADRPHFFRVATSANDTLFMAVPLAEWRPFDLSPLLGTPAPHKEGFLLLEADRLDYQLEVLGARLSASYVLQVGSDTRQRLHVLRVFQRSFLLTVIVMLAASTAGGLLFTSRSLSPLGSLSATIRSIVETGQLDRRIAPRGSNDDLDDLVSSFNAMVERINRLVVGLRDSLDSVAHDLRTPITRFRAIAERALEEDPQPSACRDALGEALEESERILGMLNAMMDISEAESGAMHLNLETVELGSLCRQVADVYSLVAEESDMTIELDLEEPLLVRADGNRLRQAIGNLIDNALKYGVSGTSVEVTGRKERAGRDNRPGEGLAVVAVRNRGPLIPEEEQQRIWTRLYRGAAGNRRDGLGLGLALVRAIVEAHGGTTDVSSSADPAGGSEALTSFRMSLPVSGAPTLAEL